MKAKYILPILWIGLELLVFVVPVPELFPVVYILSMPCAVLVLYISLAVDGPPGTTIWVSVAATIQAFLIGYALDWIVEKRRARSRLS